MLRQPMICFFQNDGPDHFAIETGVGAHSGSRRSFTAVAGRFLILLRSERPYLALPDARMRPGTPPSIIPLRRPRPLPRGMHQRGVLRRERLFVSICCHCTR